MSTMNTFRKEQIEDYRFHIGRYFKEEANGGIFAPDGKRMSLEEIMLIMMTTSYEEGWNHADHLTVHGWDYRDFLFGDQPRASYGKATLWQRIKALWS